jgi:hypothetical protein
MQEVVVAMPVGHAEVAGRMSRGRRKLSIAVDTEGGRSRKRTSREARLEGKGNELLQPVL